MSCQMRRIPQMFARRFGTSGVSRSVKAEDTAIFKKLKKQQESFNTGLGPEEVFLQGGLKDVVLYRTSVFLTVVSTLYSGKVIYDLAQK
ncbi:uncharacterized protein LOC120353062 [Nilaparvata lugens]|uniref:uncharacterized protein LOC120353062 n=1 Tax=Nilaparvata lugens TaxID=108931 RepID=UPI00193CF5F9|nr:uncharacterized protein LOC120353062 [Nilaparvata lugens]